MARPPTPQEYFDSVEAIMNGFDSAKETVRRVSTGAKEVMEEGVGPAFKRINSTTDAVEGMTQSQKRVLKTGSKFLVASTLFIGTTALLDAGMKSAQKKQAEAQNRRQLRDLKEKEKEKKIRADQYRSGVSFGHGTDAGKVVFEMFEQRTGHHKMGSSRF